VESGERQMEGVGRGFEIGRNLPIPDDLPKYHDRDAVAAL